jgi:hypothetical protein
MALARTSMAARLAPDAADADEVGALDVASTPEADGFAIEDGSGWVEDMVILCDEDMRSILIAGC